MKIYFFGKSKSSRHQLFNCIGLGRVIQHWTLYFTFTMEYKIFDWAFNLWGQGQGWKGNFKWKLNLCEIGLVHANIMLNWPFVHNIIQFDLPVIKHNISLWCRQHQKQRYSWFCNSSRLLPILDINPLTSHEWPRQIFSSKCQYSIKQKVMRIKKNINY